MEHKHAALIKRWADDTSLLALYKDRHENWCNDGQPNQPRWFSSHEYFLVCEKHVEVALHWLNGGELEFKYSPKKWLDVSELDHLDFQEVQEYRIKPKLEKVKVWIGVKNPKADVMYSNIVTSGTKPIGNEYFDNFTWTEVEANKLIQQEK